MLLSVTSSTCDLIVPSPVRWSIGTNIFADVCAKRRQQTRLFDYQRAVDILKN
jgi:hypothetical protein